MEVFFESLQSGNLLINFGLNGGEISFVSSASILGSLELSLEEFKESLGGRDEINELSLSVGDFSKSGFVSRNKIN